MRIGVVGAGISGLATVYYLQKESRRKGLEIEVSLLESSGRLGGVIRTERQDGFLLEAGPEGFAAHKPQARRLVEELGVPTAGSRDERRRTFVLRDGRLTPLPDGMMFLSPVRLGAFWRTAPLSRRGRLRALAEPLVTRSRGDLSLRQFLERRLGREFVEQVAEPLIAAVYGGDAERLSAPATMADFHRLEQRFGSLWKGMRWLNGLRANGAEQSVYTTMPEGMSQLADALESRLNGTPVHRDVKNLRLKNGKAPYRLQGRGFEGEFDRLILCSPASATAGILEGVLPETAGLLEGIPYASSRLVYLAYKRSEFSHPLDGFGFIVPPSEKASMDACTWVSSKFDDRCPESAVLLRAAVHERRGERLPEGDEQLAEAVHRDLHRILGISCAPLLHRVFHARRSMPQMLVGHPGRLAQIRSQLESRPGLHLCGAYWGGVGIPECIRTARETAEAVMGTE